MNALKLMLSLLIILYIVSCASSQPSATESDHIKGYNMAKEFAKKDAMNHTCFGYRRYKRVGFAEYEARKYSKLLQDQNRSENFIKGFYAGYESYYREFLDLYCGP
ncbi:MAG: hypothetical protein JSV38_15285 [Desulfobacterales bacterium]|nr:MAG: hypothetical protein JSV38_15285 [Desulfobacterales bacterium]